MAWLQQRREAGYTKQLESSFRRTDKEGVAGLTSDDYPTLFCRLCWSATPAYFAELLSGRRLIR